MIYYYLLLADIADVTQRHCAAEYNHTANAKLLKCSNIPAACSMRRANPSILQSRVYKNNKICIFLNHD